MGANNSTKGSPKKESLLSSEEHHQFQTAFKSILGNRDVKKIQEDALRAAWRGRVLENFLKRLLKYLLRGERSSGVDFHSFCALFVQAVRGSAEEKAALVAALASGSETNTTSTTAVIQYVEEVVRSYMAAERSTSQWASWENAGCHLEERHVTLFAASLVHDLVFPGQSPKESWGLVGEERNVELEELQRWVMACAHLSTMQAAVFERLYFGSQLHTGNDAVCLLPLCKGLPLAAGDEPFPSLLDTSTVGFLNLALPAKYRKHWRFLFSSRIHGESFSKMLGSVISQGPSLLIVQDKDGHVFGGFASDSWNLGPQFIGDETCFLFSLRPKMNVYQTTGYNHNFMYLNIQQQTMPNGLGMGGVLEYFGMFLDASFGSGMCGETCTTFHSPMLSKQKHFEVAHLEVWGVGKPPPTKEEMGERPSILDRDAEAKAILAMAGKGGHSDGLREPEQD